MILRKPYAFIIKHFRLIHLILFACLLYMLSNTNTLYQLFSSLQKSNTSIYVGADIYIHNGIYIFILGSLALSAVVYWLLKAKKKPTVLYLALVIYLIVLAIGYSYLFSTLKTLQNVVVETDTIIFSKDIANLLTLPLYVFCALCFIRGIGFNIKQFNFSKDIKELQIADQDSEEFELLIGQNNYKYIRTIRRALRETKYYILENKFALMCIGGVVLILFGALGIKYYNTYLKRVKESDVTTINSISYVVNKSFITSYDYNGNLVKKGYKYVIANVKLHNSSSLSKTIDLNSITLADGKIVYYPTLNRNGKFYDLGIPYQNKQEIKPYEEIEVTLTFEIPKGVRTKVFTLRIQHGLHTTIDSVIAQYRKIEINANNIDEKQTDITRNTNETMNVDMVGQNKFALTITGASLMDSYNNRYVTCTKELNCRPLSSVISTTAKDRQTMLVIDYKGTIYDTAKFTKTFDTYNKIFENYATIQYTIYNKEYKEKASIVPQSDVEGKIFLQVDRKIYNASHITISFAFRNDHYNIPLKF